MLALGAEPEADFFGSLGGAAKRKQVICDAIPQLYDAANNTWSLAPPLPGEPISCSTNAVRLTSGQILYAEGDLRYVLDSHQRCWAVTGAPVTQQDGILAPLPGGGALDPGHATNYGEPFAGAEIYTPGSQKCTVLQQIQTNIFSQLTPQGKKAKIAAVLAAGYSFSFKTALQGKLTVAWEDRQHESEGRLKPLLVATSQTSPSHLGVVKATLRLTAAGRHLLARVSKIKLTAKGTFSAKSGKTVQTTISFALTR
jgi:hypothetical protein